MSFNNGNSTTGLSKWQLDTVQDFFNQVGHQTTSASIYLLKINIFSLNHVIIRPTKIMNNLLKDWKIRTFKVIFQHQKSMESFWFFFCEEYSTRWSTFKNKIFWKLWFLKYLTRAIITHSWFETALDYKPRILGPTFLVYVLK